MSVLCRACGKGGGATHRRRGDFGRLVVCVVVVIGPGRGGDGAGGGEEGEDGELHVERVYAGRFNECMGGEAVDSLPSTPAGRAGFIYLHYHSTIHQPLSHAHNIRHESTTTIATHSSGSPSQAGGGSPRPSACTQMYRVSGSERYRFPRSPSPMSNELAGQGARARKISLAKLGPDSLRIDTHDKHH